MYGELFGFTFIKLIHNRLTGIFDIDYENLFLFILDSNALVRKIALDISLQEQDYSKNEELGAEKDYLYSYNLKYLGPKKNILIVTIKHVIYWLPGDNLNPILTFAILYS